MVVGVAQVFTDDPHSVSFVSRSDTTSRNNKCPRLVVEVFHCKEYLVKSHGDMPIYVFENTIRGSNLFNNFMDVRKDVSRIFRSEPFATCGKGLTWVSSTKDSDGLLNKFCWVTTSFDRDWETS